MWLESLQCLSVATDFVSGRTRRSAWIALTLVLASGALTPLARAAEDRGTDRKASLGYEPVAGYDAPPRNPGRLAPATGSLMGVHSADSTQMKPDDQGIVKLEQALGRMMDINNHYHGGWDDIAEDGLSWLEKWDVESGRIPLVGWGCLRQQQDHQRVGRRRHPQDGPADEGLRPRVLHALLLGDGRVPQAGHRQGAEAVQRAWRHMYRIFQEEGATNVIWTWTANAAGFKDKRKYTNNEPPAPYFYPGDEYVDWIASDGYNWGVSQRNQGDRWRQVLEIFDEFMVFARAHPKPIMIGEYGAQEQKQDPAGQALLDAPRPRRADGQAEDGRLQALRRLLRRGRGRVLRRRLRVPRRLADHVVATRPSSAYKEASYDPWFHQMDTIPWPP